VRHPEAQWLACFAMNRSLTEPLELTVDLRSFPAMRVAEWLTLRHDRLDAVNGPGAELIRPAAMTGAAVKRETLTALLPPASWNVIRLETDR